MGSLLKIELKKAFSNKMFLISMAIGIIIAMISAGQNIANYCRGLEMNAMTEQLLEGEPFNPMYPILSGC